MPRLWIPKTAIRNLSARKKRDPKKNDKARPSPEDGGSHHEPTHYVHRYLAVWHCHYLVSTPGQWPLVAWPRERGSHHEPTLSSLWKYLWVTLSAMVTTPRQCPLVRPWNKKKEKVIKKRKNEGNKGLGKNCIHDRYNSPSTKAPTDNITLVFHSICMSGNPLTTPPRVTWIGWYPLETFLFLWMLAQ